MDDEVSCNAICSSLVQDEVEPSKGESERTTRASSSSSPSSEEVVEVGTDIASLVVVGDSVSACAVADTENEVAPQCNAETPLYSHSVHFTELPDLVVDEILTHLDLHTKLQLRLTCRTTKRWVENGSKLLSLFHLKVTSNEVMTNVLKNAKIFPESKWRNVEFTERNFASYDGFPSFVSIFSFGVTTLHLQNFNGGLAQILFLSSCENLEHLRIDEMDLRENPALVVASDKTLKAKCPKLMDIFTELKELHIGTVFFNDVKHLPFYQTFLQRCRKLELLNVPRTQGPPSISWEALKGIQLKYFIGPIKEYLQKKPITSPIKTDIEILDVGGLFSRHFPAVAEACVQIGAPTLFKNVNEKHVKYLFTHEGDILQRILSLQEKIDDRRPIAKWENLEKLHVRSSRCDVRNEYGEEDGFTAFPKLRTLSLLMDSRSREDPNFGMLHRLVQLLIRRPRENLRSFLLQWPLFAHDTPQDYIRARDFVGNFLNLTKLQISGWTAPDDDFLLVFEILGGLQELVLEECLNLTDWGVLGPGELPRPAIMNLQSLKRLEIRNRNNPGYITHNCFERAFCHMRLNYFLVDSFHVTQEGYKFLADGEFSTTIGRLPVPHVLPRGVATEQDFISLVTSYFPRVIL